ncbi:hypothetical protein D3C73_1436910 [compost metagenome]
MTAGIFERGQHRVAGLRVRKMGPGDGQTAGRRDVLFIHIAGDNRHIRAVVTVKNERKGVPVFNAE